MKRQDGSVDFNKEWEDYKHGFGSLNGEFWAGNEMIPQLTTGGQTYTLRVDLKNYDGVSIYAKYDSFLVDSEYKKYRLSVSGYDVNSTADNSLADNNNCEFSTASIDNDIDSSIHRANMFSAPWWYCYGGSVILTGEYGENANFGIIWAGPFSYWSFYRDAVVMVRPN
ncbi:hypothetical protein LSH36_1923g00000 [Paralvinella palmiformis]|uniref:Fibrinogen C-terminal domain-containing protein n=1 Tax=Paralvinella palmiformis TaxID=53620 RepID=A0AAD9IRI6_9ANNE|nr:hypothetical protein LSH36_1923g00000 [Paralvinella palmiformis]